MGKIARFDDLSWAAVDLKYFFISFSSLKLRSHVAIDTGIVKKIL